jgi:hypothetical protein
LECSMVSPRIIPACSSVKYFILLWLFFLKKTKMNHDLKNKKQLKWKRKSGYLWGYILDWLIEGLIFLILINDRHRFLQTFFTRLSRSFVFFCLELPHYI